MRSPGAAELEQKHRFLAVFQAALGSAEVDRHNCFWVLPLLLLIRPKGRSRGAAVIPQKSSPGKVPEEASTQTYAFFVWVLRPLQTMRSRANAFGVARQMPGVSLQNPAAIQTHVLSFESMLQTCTLPLEHRPAEYHMPCFRWIDTNPFTSCGILTVSIYLRPVF